MKVHAVGNEKIGVGAGIGCTVRTQDVARDFVQVEGGGEEVVAVIGAENSAFVAEESAFGGVACLEKRVGQTRIWPFYAAILQRVVLFPVHSAVKRVRDAVA